MPHSHHCQRCVLSAQAFSCDSHSQWQRGIVMIATLLQIININWLNVEGYPVRNDNETNFSYVGKGAGDGTCCPTAAHLHARWNPHARMHDICCRAPWPLRWSQSYTSTWKPSWRAAGWIQLIRQRWADRWPLLCGLDHRPAGDTPPEVYNAYWPDDPTKSDPIPPGKTTYLRNKHTNKYCRLAPLTTQTSAPARTRAKVAATVAMSSGRRMLLADPSSCFDQGVLCDQATPAGA
jgi:hypothetical protein